MTGCVVILERMLAQRELLKAWPYNCIAVLGHSYNHSRGPGSLHRTFSGQSSPWGATYRTAVSSSLSVMP